MAKYGGDKTFENPAFEPDLDIGGGDDQQALSETQPFQPGAASTPYHGGEQYEMKTMMSEESGGRPSYEETDFGGNERTHLLETDSNLEEALHNLQRGEGPGIHEILKRDQFTGAINQKETPVPNVDALPLVIRKDIIADAKRFILSRFPNAKLESLVLAFHKRNPIELLVRGPGGGGTPVFLKDGSDFQQSFLKLKYVKNALGEPAESKIMQTSAEIRKLQKERDKMRREQKIYHEKKSDKRKRRTRFETAHTRRRRKTTTASRRSRFR